MTPTTACQPIARKYYSIADARALTGLARNTLTTAILDGRLRAFKPTPRRVLIAAEDLDNFIRATPAVSEPNPAA